MKKLFKVFPVLFILFAINVMAVPKVEAPLVVLNGIEQSLELSFESDTGTVLIKGVGAFQIEKGKVRIEKVKVPIPLHLSLAGSSYTLEQPGIPGFFSLLPPLVAIGCAFFFKDVLIALFLGVLLGMVLIHQYNPFIAIFELFNSKFVEILADSFHIKMLIFTMMMAGFITLLRRSGALQDLVDRLRKFISTPRSGMVSTFLAGIIIFFDDYSNTLIIGNTFRPLTDKLKISREKLAYLVDSTAAPVASIALSTWIGMEISLMHDAYQSIDPNVSGVELFAKSWPYSFYSIFTLVFVFCISVMNRDYSRMGRAEARARNTGKLMAEDATPMQDEDNESMVVPDKIAPFWVAAGPLVAMVLMIVALMYITGGNSVGFDKPLRDILYNSDSTASLMFGPVFAILVFIVLNFKNLKLVTTMSTMLSGFKSMTIVILILTLAWSLASLCNDLSTSSFIISVVGEGLKPFMLPTIIFLISGFIAFATGTSWGTMAVMFPLAVPLVGHVLSAHGMSMPDPILYASMGSILTGSVLGDHISPISDTTLFSSMASGCDHIDHVNTQTPYALTVGAISILIGTLPAGFGLPWGVSLLLGITTVFLVVRFVGKKNPA